MGLSHLFHVVKAAVLVSLDVDEVQRRRPDLGHIDENEPEAADTMEDQYQCEDELEDFERLDRANGQNLL